MDTRSCGGPFSPSNILAAVFNGMIIAGEFAYIKIAQIAHAVFANHN